MTTTATTDPSSNLTRAVVRARDYLARALRRPATDERLRRIQLLEAEVQRRESRQPQVHTAPVVFFVMSVHTTFLNLPSAVALLASWSLRLAGSPVRYFLCQRGVSQCVLGANRNGVLTPPPCDACIAFRREIYPSRHTSAFTTARSERPDLSQLSMDELARYEFDGIPLGALCLPSLRWVERRSRLQPTDSTRALLAEFVSSAVAFVARFDVFLQETRPHAVVLFNGTHYPESIARRIAMRRGVRVVTFETGLTGVSAFFSHGVATEYNIRIPEDFVFGPAEQERLKEYMAARSTGNFTVGGRRIWSKTHALPVELQQRVEQSRHVVTVFTNVTWDTSQAYAHAVFADMFDWLESTLARASEHPDTLFVVRAHPDELRVGKPSNETTGAWLRSSGFSDLPNVVYLPGDLHLSSYELIERSKFCIVYNSTVGLEAAAMGRAVLTGARTRYGNVRIGYQPESRNDYERMLDELLAADEPPAVPNEWVANARRFFYYSLFHASLDFSGFLRPNAIPDFSLADFDATALAPEASPVLAAIRDGIVFGREFHL